MRRWLVAGGTGFVGKRFVKQLRGSGDEIFCLSRSEANDTIVGDIFDARRMRDVLETIAPTHLALLAWTTEHGVFWSDPANQAWHVASSSLAERFLVTGGKAILGVGTCAEYDWDGSTLVEDRTAIRPRTAYGLAKAALWSDLTAACEHYGACFTWARMFFVYGPGEDPDKLVTSLVRSGIDGEPARLREPERRLDFVHVDDAARALALLAALEAPGAYNVASGAGTALRDVASLAGALLAPADTISMNEREPDVVGDIARLSKLGWAPDVELPAGIAQLRRSLLGEGV